MGTARAGIGTLLQMAPTTSPTNFTTIALVGDIGGPSMTAGTYDSTTQDVTDGYKTFITGLKDGGEVTFPLFFDASEATHKDASGGLVDAFNNSLLNYWRIKIADQSPQVNWTFRGVVTKLDFSFPVDGIQKCNATIKVSGKATLA